MVTLGISGGSWLAMLAARGLPLRGVMTGWLLTLAMALSACNVCRRPLPVPPLARRQEVSVQNPYSAPAADAQMTRAPFFVESLKLAGRSGEAWRLVIVGSLPSPCHQLRLQIPAQPDATGLLRLEAWSIVDPKQMCAQMLQPATAEVLVPGGALRVALDDQSIQP